MDKVVEHEAKSQEKNQVPIPPSGSPKRLGWDPQHKMPPGMEARLKQAAEMISVNLPDSARAKALLLKAIKDQQAAGVPPGAEMKAIAAMMKAMEQGHTSFTQGGGRRRRTRKSRKRRGGTPRSAASTKKTTPHTRYLGPAWRANPATRRAFATRQSASRRAHTIRNTPAFNPRVGSLVTLTGDLGMTGAGGEHGKVGKLIKKNNATKKAVVRLHYNGSDRVVPLSNLTKATAGDKKAPMNKKSNRFDPYRTPYSYDTERMNKA